MIKKEIISVLSERESEQVRGGGFEAARTDNTFYSNCLCATEYCCEGKDKKSIINEDIYTTTHGGPIKPYTYGPGCIPGTGQSQAQACFIDGDGHMITEDCKNSVNVCITPTITEKDCFFPGHI